MQLAGDAWYFGKKYEKPWIGDDVRPIERRDIARSCRLMFAASYLTAAIALAVKGAFICFLL